MSQIKLLIRYFAEGIFIGIFPFLLPVESLIFLIPWFAVFFSVIAIEVGYAVRDAEQYWQKD